MSNLLDVSGSITRPADAAPYAIGDAMANSTSAPTTGGFTFSDTAGFSGGGGIITDAVVVSSNPAALVGEIWLFSQAVTAVNDNAAFALSDSDMATAWLGKIAFTTAVEATNNSSVHVVNVNMGFHSVGTSHLRFLIKVMNAYTPASGEVITVRLKGFRV